MNELHKNLRLNNVSDSKEILKEMFLYIADVAKYIDDDIYLHIRTLKNDILSASLKKGWFKPIKFRNKSSLSDNAEIIVKVINQKLTELESYVSSVF